ncbi:SH3 domain-containing protein [Candidatus Latescibacterota bacterium]
MKKLFGVASIILCTFAPLTSPPQAQTTVASEAAQEYNEAGRFYQTGDFREALSRYEHLIARGIEHPDLYFNASNAAYRSGNLGQAILSIERSLKLNPSDEDALANRAFLNSLRQDQGPAEDNPVLALIERTYETITLNGALNVSAVMFAGAMLLFSSALFWERWKRRVLVTCGVIFCLFFLGSTGIALYKMNRLAIVHDAIILADEAYSYSGPGTDNVHIFTIHEGTKVTVERRERGWCLIRLQSGAGGWIQTDALEEI